MPIKLTAHVLISKEAWTKSFIPCISQTLLKKSYYNQVDKNYILDILLALQEKEL